MGRTNVGHYHVHSVPSYNGHGRRAGKTGKLGTSILPHPPYRMSNLSGGGGGGGLGYC